MNEVKELVEELRNKKSRDNRELLDRSADMIEKLAKELCEKSGCHHKCHDTKDCVVEDEALLLINENKSNNSDFKSNNFEVKSNEELFKQALVEGLNRHFDKTIEEAKKIEQIEEMAKVLKDYTKKNNIMASHVILEDYAEQLYKAGFCKREWISVEERLPYKASVKRVLIQAPTADVVPKSEVAREIFEEIENRAFGFGACFVEMTRTTFDEIKKKYTK